MSTTRASYRFHMHKYATETAACSFTKYDHPSFKAILAMGWDAVPFLLGDIQSQHPDGSWTPGQRDFSYWGATSLVWHIVGDKAPVLPEKDRGRLAPIRKMWVDWGVEHGYLHAKDEPTIPIRFDQIHRLVPNKFFGLRNYIWRLTTLPNTHRMKHKWDFWRAI